MNIEEIKEGLEIKTNIRTLDDEETASIMRIEEEICIVAYNQGGYDCTTVPIKDIIEWVKEHAPELLNQ